MDSRYVGGEDNRPEKISLEISRLEKVVKSLDRKKVSEIEKIAKTKAEVTRLRQDKTAFFKLKNNITMYDMFIQSVSRKGIPLQIMMSQLPIINEEISKILQGVTGFTVELEADLDSNSMDVFINYGDSRRIIELASGMEKMMASLAIRVALINVSTLTKTNILIIDEGFGALDETNIEACTRLLKSLKKWFRNILVISHVDSIKDAVDNSLEIVKNEKDANVYQP
jgi:exonuclease SbcC